MERADRSPAASRNRDADAQLIADLHAGQENALAALYDRYGGIVYAVALRVLGDTSAAEDVVQDIFLQLWRNPGIFDPARGSLAAWLGVLARNRAIDTHRRRRPQTDLADAQLACPGDLEDEAVRHAVVAKAREQLAQMPPGQRQVLELAFFEGLTHTEIAERTGEPLGTVKTRIRSGLIAMRKALAA